MDAAEIATLITSIVALIGGGAALWKMSRIEQPHSDADLAGKYRTMAVESATNESTMRRRIDELELRLDELEQSWTDAEHHINALDDYIEELIGVMKAHGMQPIKPKPVRRQRTQPRAA